MKSLKKGSISLIGAVAIGLAATAPAYSLTGALGHGADEAGYQMPVVFIIAVIPMYFIALAYKHLTDAAPDAGTVFTWGSKAILPHIGWIGGFALMLSSILAGVGAAGITVSAATSAFGIDDPPDWLKVVIAAVFIFITTWLVARGAEESSRTTIILTVIQYGGLLVFAAILAINIFRSERMRRRSHSRGSGLIRLPLPLLVLCSADFWWRSSSSGASMPPCRCRRRPRALPSSPVAQV
jgi:amino acid transporter